MSEESPTKCVASCKDGSPCNAYPIQGSDKCRMHAGTSSDGESHDGNQNAQTHSLFSSHDGYYQDLEEGEQEWVFDFTHTLLDRYRESHGDEPDMFDKEALKNIAIDFHRVATANSWFSKNGMVHQDISDTPQSFSKTTKVNVWASEIRQYNESIYRRMQKHGLLDDPESAKAEATRSIAEILSENN